MVLAGGRSSRFKRGNKLSAPVLGELLIEHVVRVARRVAGEVLIVGKGLPPKEFRRARWVSEAFSDHSPLYGILTGLKEARGEKVLILPGDCPLIRAQVLEFLMGKEPPAFVENNYLLALLRKVDWLTVEEMVKRGEHRVRELHRKLGSREIKLERIYPFDPGGESFKNLNYYRDYRNLFSGERK